MIVDGVLLRPELRALIDPVGCSLPYLGKIGDHLATFETWALFEVHTTRIHGRPHMLPLFYETRARGRVEVERAALWRLRGADVSIDYRHALYTENVVDVDIIVAAQHLLGR